MKKRSMGILLSCLLAVSQLTLSTVAQARKSPSSPDISSNSSTVFTQTDVLYPWVGVTVPETPKPTFDFSGDDIVVNVNHGTIAAVTVVNISLPSAFNVTAGSGAVVAVNDGNSSTVCDTTSIVSTVSPQGVTAKGFNCSDPDGNVEFTFTVSGLQGQILTTSFGAYPIESQFRTVNSRSSKNFAWIVDPTDLDPITLETP